MKRKLKHACCAVRVHTLIMNSFFGGVVFFFFCVSSPQDLTKQKRGGGEDCVLVICILLSCALVAFLRIANYKFNVFFTLNWHIFLDRNVKKNSDWII